MRRFVAVLLAISVLILLVSPSLAAEKPYWGDSMQSVHAGFQGTAGYVAQFGDSITYSMAFWSPLGWDDPDQYLTKDDGLPRRPQQRWRDVLRGFRAKGPEQGNYSGWRVGDVLKAMDEVLRREKPEVAIIMVGTNDISGGKVPDGYRDGLKKIVQKCLDAHCVPILNTIPPRRGHDAAVEAANRIVREVAQESKVPLADFYAECLRLRPGKSWDKTIISDDGVHPSSGKNQVYSEENLKVCGYALRNWVNFLAVREVYFRVLAAPRMKTEEAPQPRTRSAERQTGYDARFVKMNNVPKKLLAGQVFYVEYTMKNTGSEGWGPDNEKHTVLRSREPDDNKTWGTFFITQGQGTAVPPGKEFTYRSWLMAPSTPGEHVLQWQPAKWEGEGYAGRVTPFGEPTPRLVIQVQQRPDEPALPAPPSQAPGEKQVLAMDDFEYAGSFKIPDREGHDLPFSHSGLALRKMKDGTKRLLFNYTHPKVALVEVEIPPLVKLDEEHGYAALKIAEVKRAWGKLEIKVPKAKMADSQDSIWANAGYCWDEANKTLYWTWTHDYWCGEPPLILGASRLADDGTVTHLGTWKVGPGMYKWYWGGVTKLPREFAEKYTAGRTLAVGFGSGYSGTYADSHGPSLSAIAIPDPNKDTVEATHLLGYYKGQSAPRDGRYFIATNDATGTSWMGSQPESPAKGTCGSGDLVRSGIFIETPEKHAFIAFVNLQLGRIGYDYGSGYSPSRVNCWYFYDPKDLGEASVRKKIAVTPRSRANVDPPEGKDFRPSLANCITGSCFDEEESLLYVYTFLTGRGCIDAYRVK